MSKVVDVPAESLPASPEEGFEAFRAEQRASKSGSSVDKTVEEAAPQSEAEEVKPKQSQPLPEEMVEAKRRNNERRAVERERELSELKAENERLKSGQAAKPAESAPAAKTKPIVADDPNDPEPQEADYLAKGEAGFREYTRACNAWDFRRNQRQAKVDAAAEAVKTAEKSAADTFVGKMEAYAADHADFDESLQVVTDALAKDSPAVGAAVSEADNAAELIDYLGKNPEVLARLTALKDSPRKALIELGRIVAAQFDTPVSDEPKPRKVLPKPPATVTGGRHTPTGNARLDAMAAADDLPNDWRTHMPKPKRR